MAEPEVDLQALGIADDEPYDQGVDGELPQQIGLWFPAPQPGNDYSFFIPGPMIWLPEQVLENGVPANRPRLYFRSVKDKPASKGANPLQILSSPKDGVKYLDRFRCANPKCEAQVRMFAQLGNFRPASVTVEEA